MRRPGRAARLLAALLLLALALYPFMPEPGGAGGSGKRLPTLMEEAVLHFNLSTGLLLEGSPADPGLALEAVAVAGNLSTVAQLADPRVDESLLGVLGQAAGEYSRLATASGLAYNLTLIHAEVQDDIRSVIGSLMACRLGEALDAWYNASSSIGMLLSGLEDALELASSVDPSLLLSEGHRMAYAEGLSRLQGLHHDLSLLYSVIEKVEQAGPEAGCEDLALILPPGLVQAMMQGSGYSSSPYTYELYRLLSSLSQHGSGRGGVGYAGSPDDTGGGAGWWEPESDD